jgi:hypothetical protein
LEQPGIVRILARFMFLFMALRVLQPPGVCVCELSECVAHILDEALGEPRPSMPYPEEDPVYGCILCQLPPGIEAKPAPAPSPPICSPQLLPVTHAVAFTPLCLSLDSSLHCEPAERDLFLRHCSFLI